MNNRELFRQNLQALPDDELAVKGKQVADNYEKMCLDGSVSAAAFLYFDLRQIEDEMERRHKQATPQPSSNPPSTSVEPL